MITDGSTINKLIELANIEDEAERKRSVQAWRSSLKDKDFQEIDDFVRDVIVPFAKELRDILYNVIQERIGGASSQER